MNPPTPTQVDEALAWADSMSEGFTDGFPSEGFITNRAKVLAAALRSAEEENAALRSQLEEAKKEREDLRLRASHAYARRDEQQARAEAAESSLVEAKKERDEWKESRDFLHALQADLTNKLSVVESERDLAVKRAGYQPDEARRWMENFHAAESKLAEALKEMEQWRFEATKTDCENCGAQGGVTSPICSECWHDKLKRTAAAESRLKDVEQESAERLRILNRITRALFPAPSIRITPDILEAEASALRSEIERMRPIVNIAKECEAYPCEDNYERLAELVRAPAPIGTERKGAAKCVAPERHDQHHFNERCCRGEHLEDTAPAVPPKEDR